MLPNQLLEELSSNRDTGKLCFAMLREGEGTELQVMLSLDKVGETQLETWKADIDIGDIVSVTGEVITFKTRRALNPC